MIKKIAHLLFFVNIALFAAPIFNKEDSLLHYADTCKSSGQICKILTNRTLGKLYFEQGKLPEALKYYQKALELAQHSNLRLEIARCLYELGVAYNASGDYTPAMRQFSYALEIGSNSINGVEKSRILSGLAHAHLLANNYEEAFRQQRDALYLAEQNADSNEMARAHYGLGNIFKSQEKYDISLENYQQASSLFPKQSNSIDAYLCLSAIASVYEKTNNPAALLFNVQALQMAEQMGYLKSAANSMQSIGTNYLSLGNYDKARHYFEQALEMAQKNQNLLLKASSCHSLGKLHLATQHLKESGIYLEEAIQLAEKLRDKPLMRDICGSKSEWYKQNNDYKNAYEWQSKYITLKDSITKENTSANVAKIQWQYENKQRQREQEMELLKKDRQINNIYVASFVLVALLGLGLLGSTFQRYRSLSSINELLQQKNHEIALQNEKLTASNRDLEQFAYVASHDLKEPLRIIGSYTDLLNRRYQDLFDPNAKEFMGFISNAVKRMNVLLNDLLDYSRVGRINTNQESINLNDILLLVSRTLQTTIDTTKAQLHIGQLPIIYANRSQMLQLFQNILANALKFKKEDKAPIIYVEYTLLQGEHLLSVRDNGIGIEKDHLDRIFIVFQRLHLQQEYEGTGIGLAICKKIVTYNKGRIWAESEPGKGTTFYIALPVQASEENIPKMPEKELQMA